MPQSLALMIWLFLLLGLLYFDPAKEPRTSPALWVPVIWMFFLGSRLPSQWLGAEFGQSANALEEGNPIDRAVLSTLILLAILILLSRGFQWGGFLLRNSALVAFVMFALVSVCWSDFPFVALKRWFRDLGNYLMILVVFSDPVPLEAVRTLLRRLSYLLIPLSILLFKYFPALGMQYTQWSGARMFVGATTSKNMLGVACLLSGVYFFWDAATRWTERKERRNKRILTVNLVFFVMTLWLLRLADSATSRVCLAMACIIIMTARSRWAERHSGVLKMMIPAGFCLYLILAFGFNLNGELASQVGRDPTLTDRTLIWNAVLSTHTNPLLGAGYESFWLGPRLEWIWKAVGPINESHNGYIEVYLNLGLIGVFLIGGMLISSYRGICKSLKPTSSVASLHLALWTIVLFYNITEAAFRPQLMWVAFLLITVTVPARAAQPLGATPVIENVGAASVGRRRWEATG
jgi:exopolysaccharide production protein ExoQ